jgi:DNA-binding NarL/FixJ family response regulator
MGGREAGRVIRISVVAPAMAFRAGLRAMLSAAPGIDAGPPLEVVYEAASLEEFDPQETQSDVLVVTSLAASSHALQTILRRSEGHLAVLLLSDEPRAVQVIPRLPARAWGALAVEASEEELIAAVRALHEGLWVGSPALMEPVFSQRLVAGREEEFPIEPLTERENQILQLLARGMANKQIAAALGISEHTVKFHVSSIYTKLGATNRTEAVRIGLQQGLVLL